MCSIYGRGGYRLSALNPLHNKEDFSFEYVDIDYLLGRMFVKISVSEDKQSVVFRETTGCVVIMQCVPHDLQGEGYLESVDGDLKHLVGRPIIVAEERYSIGTETTIGEHGDPWFPRWAFYKIGTNRGVITFRWCESSGDINYSADVYFFSGKYVGSKKFKEKIEK